MTVTDGGPPTARDPLDRVAELGGRVAAAPWRALGTVVEPLRADLRRDLRRTLGVTEEPRPPATDPARAFVAPGSVVRRVHADLPAMVIAGVGALLLQTLHPLAMAGVAEHSNYAEDPTGRMRRTAAFVGTTTYGTVEEAERAIAAVHRVHRAVHGTAPDGRPYRASDPDLVTWVHVAEMSTVLAAARRFGPYRFTPKECDEYYAGTAPVARALGATWVPTTADEVTAYFARVRPELYAGPQALAARDFLVRGVATRPEDRAVYAVVVAAAVSLLPGWARAALHLPHPPLADRLVVVPAGRALCAALRWVVAPVE